MNPDLMFHLFLITINILAIGAILLAMKQYKELRLTLALSLFAITLFTTSTTYSMYDTFFRDVSKEHASVIESIKSPNCKEKHLTNKLVSKSVYRSFVKCAVSEG